MIEWIKTAALSQLNRSKKALIGFSRAVCSRSLRGGKLMVRALSRFRRYLSIALLFSTIIVCFFALANKASQERKMGDALAFLESYQNTIWKILGIGTAIALSCLVIVYVMKKRRDAQKNSGATNDDPTKMTAEEKARALEKAEAEKKWQERLAGWRRLFWNFLITAVVVYGMWAAIIGLAFYGNLTGLFRWIWEEDERLIWTFPTMALIVTLGMRWSTKKEKAPEDGKSPFRTVAKIFSCGLLIFMLTSTTYSFFTKATTWQNYQPQLAEYFDQIKPPEQKYTIAWKFDWWKPDGVNGNNASLRTRSYESEIDRNDEKALCWTVYGSDNHRPVAARFTGRRVGDRIVGEWSQNTPEDNPKHGSWYINQTGPDESGAYHGFHRDQKTPEGRDIPFTLRPVKILKK